MASNEAGGEEAVRVVSVGQEPEEAVVVDQISDPVGRLFAARDPPARACRHEALDHGLVLFGRDRAGRVDEASSGPQDGRGGFEQRALDLRELGEVFGAHAPARIGIAAQRAESRAGGIDEDAVEGAAVLQQIGEGFRGVALEDGDAAELEPAQPAPDETQPSLVAIEGEDVSLTGESFGDRRGLGTGRGADVEDALAGLGIEPVHDELRGFVLWADQARQESGILADVAAGAEDDAQYDAGLRPRSLNEYIGQDRVRDNLTVSIAAARGRSEALDHVLVYGPPGLGKTTLAYVIGNEMGVPVRATAGPVIERPGDLAAMLTNLQQHEVLFIDEIHRLAPAIEEILYPAMEDYELDIVIGQGPSARSVKVPLQKFTLIGATTRAGLLSAPLRARFGIVHRLDFYEERDIHEIVRRSARILDIPVDEDAGREIARRSRGTPRIANRLLRRVRDYAQVRADGRVTLEVATAALKLLEVDDHGFDEVDRRLLRTIIDKFSGGPVGVNSLAAAIHEEKDAIEDMYEPFLIQAGFLDRTPRGRVATARAYEYFGLQPPEKDSRLW